MNPPELLPAAILGDRHRPAIVFLHGFLGSGEDWREIVDRLRDAFCCVTIDLPGHGAGIRRAGPADYGLERSGAAVAASVRALDLVEPAIVGYSMGGRVALQLLCDEPALFSTGVLESAHPGLEDPTERNARWVSDQRIAERLGVGRLDDFLADWYRQPLFCSLQNRPDRLEQVLRARGRQDPRELALALRGLSVGRQPPLWNRLGRVAAPLLWVAGRLDVKYVGVARRGAEAAGQGMVALIDDAGHNTHLEQPDRFAKLVREFLGNRAGARRL